jgi:cell division protease FtsH
MNFRNLLLWVSIFSIVIYVMHIRQSVPVEKLEPIKFSEFLSRVEQNKVSDVVIRGNEIDGHTRDGKGFNTYAPNDSNVVDTLIKRKVVVSADKPKETPLWYIALISWLPTLLWIIVAVFFIRQFVAGTAGRAMGFGKSKAKLSGERATKVTFADVAGIEEAKEELVELVEFLKDPTKFQALGGTIPKGCLLIGAPGCGKTLIARAVAGEAGVPFFSISGSDFVEMFVGVGASRVRDMFEQAKKSAPCIIFIDEIDAVGRHRGISLGSGNDEREQTLNQLLVEMDGFEENNSVIIIAATNRPDVLDAALLRPGRFDRQINVPSPDVRGREAILNVHLKKVVVSPDVDVRTIARGTPGFSGAELRNLVNEAALLAARYNKKIISTHELEEAKDKVLMGPQRKSMLMSEEVKKVTAYHEGGHALVSIYSKSADPIHKATIVPRGRALGLVMSLPEVDRMNLSFEQLKAQIAVCMGGRVAERLIFGTEKVETGASSDIKQATRLARAMVRELGMSDKLGPIFYGGESQDVFSYQGTQQKLYSTKTEELIDKEVARLVQEGYDAAHKILTKYKAQLHKIAAALLEQETLTGHELKEIVFGKKKALEMKLKEEAEAMKREEKLLAKKKPVQAESSN